MKNVIEILIQKNLEKTIIKFNNYSTNTLLIIILILIFEIPFSINYILLKLCDDSEITITIRGTGTQKILSREVDIDDYSGPLPNHIYINGTEKYANAFQVSGLTNEVNEITLKWDSPISTCYCMFNYMKNIIKIDASKFDTSKVTDMTAMFYQCTSLTSINLNNWNTSSVGNMVDMFSGCSSLISLNLGNFDTQKVTNFGSMFSDCSNMNTLDLSSFQTKSSSDASDIFNGCNSAIKVCLNVEKAGIIASEINPKNKIDCNEVYNRLYKKLYDQDVYLYSCQDNYTYRFEYNNLCYESCPENTYYNSILCIDIPEGYYLNDSNLMTIDKCLEKCKTCSNYSIYLNLCISCNGDEGYFPLLNNDINNSFINCQKEGIEGYYLENNMYRPCYKTCKACNISGNELSHNCSECKINYSFLNDSNYNYNMNCYEICDYFYYFDEFNKYKCTINELCPDDFNKLIPHKKKCTSNCSLDNDYPFEFNNTCYNSCPEGMIIYNNLCLLETQDNINNSNINNNTYNMTNDTNDNTITNNADNNKYNMNKTNNIDYANDYSIITYLINNNSNISYTDIITNDHECDLLDFFDGECNINNNSIDEIVSYIRNGILNKDLLLKLVNGNRENIIKKEDNVIYSVSFLDNQENYKFNITTINIGECEDILREIYKLKGNETLFIFKIEYFDNSFVIPIVRYEIYTNNIKSQLNMDYCKDVKIEMNIPVSINEDNLFKYDPSNAYYKDICFPYTTEDNTDIIISDRQKEFNEKNMSLCESNCIYNGYDSETKKAFCSCQIKNGIPLISEILNNKDKIIKKFIDIKNIANIEIIKCYFVLFQKGSLKTNIGSYVILSIVFIKFILMILFIFKGYNKFKNFIIEIISNNGEKIKKGKVY